MAMGIMIVTLSQWFSNGGMHTLRGRAGCDQFGALGKIFAGAPYPFGGAIFSAPPADGCTRSIRLYCLCPEPGLLRGTVEYCRGYSEIVRKERKLTH